MHYKKIILGFLLSFLVLHLNAQNTTTSLLQNIGARDSQTLNGRWQIIVDPLENGYYNYRYLPRDDGYFKNAKMQKASDLIEYDFDTDDELMVPGDWNTQSDKLYYYEGTIWYKKSFDFVEKKNQLTYLYFEAINYDAKVYLNGEYIGSHIGGYTPFQFEVSAKLKAKDNFLVVKVDNKRKREAVPTVNTDWWNYGGITRSVHLINVPKEHIADYVVRLSKEKPNTIEGWVSLSGSQPNDKLTISIAELGKKTTIKVDEKGIGNFSFAANPMKWSPKNPKLYDVTISSASDKVVDQIGFRTIETKGSNILLNGERIFLKGISIHEEAPFKTGRVTSVEECRILLDWAKELGCNFIRLAHYPHSEAMVKEAEKRGFLIWSEIPVYWTILYDNPDTYANAEEQLTTMISRDKNRAGVILWSIANETPISESRNLFLKKLATKARALDNSRLITAALDTQSGGNGDKTIEDSLGEVVDVIGINNYCGWYYGEPSDCAAIRWKNKFNKPMIMSEIGGGALQGKHGEVNERWTEEYQEEVYKTNIEMMRHIDFLSGISPWILMDFRSPRRHLKKIQKDFNRKGLISEQGERKKAFYILQDYYKNENLEDKK
jgi:beta-glucuronidase